MPIDVVPYSAHWPAAFDRVAGVLRTALVDVPAASVEHVGSTSVPGLAAKPVLDIDVIVDEPEVPAAVAALESIGYVHRGDLGVTGREAFVAPDDDPRRHVYVCLAGTLNVRNHLAVRDVLRRRDDLRDEYAAVKLAPGSGSRHGHRHLHRAQVRQCSRRCSAVWASHCREGGRDLGA